MIAFTDDHRQAHGVEPICKVLPIALLTYHAHVARRADLGKLPTQARSDVALMVEIRRVFEANFHVYGVYKGTSVTSGLSAYNGFINRHQGPRSAQG